MQSAEIRQSFLAFFRGKEHLVMPSSSLIPAGDPTLLLTSAGMVQFKPYFTGEMDPPNRRLTSIQKCFRATDIDEVGDTSHQTFFEMLGNFSIGDYFKDQAIAWAWEYVTGQLKLLPERLWVTVFSDDDDAYDLWVRTGVPPERIRRFGEKDNWWGPAGNEGPCGPCSEIHYDFGGECRLSKPEIECGPNCNCGRFLELWNLVFMQFYQNLQGERTLLPAPNIDTGMGLERAARILQEVDSSYDTDLFKPIISCVEDLSGTRYGRDRDKDIAIRVVAEHSRSAVFLIADGVVPSNDGRGYVLRRLIRRAIRHARKLALESSLVPVAEVVIDQMGDHYSELVSGKKFVLQVLQEEEKGFSEVIQSGLPLLEDALIPLRKRLQSLSRDGGGMKMADLGTIRGEIQGKIPDWIIDRVYQDLEERLPVDAADQHKFLSTLTSVEAFILYDTYGFPVEETAEIAREHNLSVDMQGFEEMMGAQRRRSRAAGGKFDGDFDLQRRYEPFGQTTFLGYQVTDAPSEIVGLLVEGTSVKEVLEGQQLEVVLRETAFYAEGGGQVGDTGEIRGPKGAIQVLDTQSPVTGLIVHLGHVVRGTVAIGESVTGTVDNERRQDTARNHTATHLLHAALRQILGSHVRQTGSLVTPDRLRFDFTHTSPLTGDELKEIERVVNAKVRENGSVKKRETTFRQAAADGALAFFGDRYGDQVRVVEVGNGETFSLEVCGGTHVGATGDVGYIHVVGDSSIGAGVRRLEAFSGRFAEAIVRQQSGLVERISRKLDTSPAELEKKVIALSEEVVRLRREAVAVERESSRKEAKELLSKIQELGGVKVVVERVNVSSVGALRETGDWLRDKLGSGVVVLGAIVADQPVLIAMVTSDLAAGGLHAGKLAEKAARSMGGGGGGRAEMAQAGGRRPEALDTALRSAARFIRNNVVAP